MNWIRLLSVLCDHQIMPTVWLFIQSSEQKLVFGRITLDIFNLTFDYWITIRITIESSQLQLYNNKRQQSHN